MRLNTSITTVNNAYEYALAMLVAWGMQRQGEEIYASADDAANRADNDTDMATALDQRDAGTDMLERGYNMTVALSSLAVAAGVMDAVLAIVEPLYCL